MKNSTNILWSVWGLLTGITLTILNWGVSAGIIAEIARYVGCVRELYQMCRQNSLGFVGIAYIVLFGFGLFTVFILLVTSGKVSKEETLQQPEKDNASAKETPPLSFSVILSMWTGLNVTFVLVLIALWQIQIFWSR